MPLVKKRIFLAAGATSSQVLSGTTFEYVDPNTVLRVAAAVDTAGTSATADTTMTFTVTNTEFSRNVPVSKLFDVEPFSAAEGSNYVMNNMITTVAIRNRPIITFTNTTAATRTIDVAVFIGN